MSKRLDAATRQKINEEVLATVARAREALKRKSEWEASAGITREGTERDYANLSEPARAWVNTLVNATMKRISQPQTGTPTPKPRKVRTMV